MRGGSGIRVGLSGRNLPVADEYAIGFRLLDLAYGVLRHARERTELENGMAVWLGNATTGLRRQLSNQLRPGRSVEHGEPDCPEG